MHLLLNCLNGKSERDLPFFLGIILGELAASISLAAAATSILDSSEWVSPIQGTVASNSCQNLKPDKWSDTHVEIQVY